MGFNWLDGFIVIAYLIAITLYGSHFRKKQQSIHTYFLGGKTTPAWALSLSIVATETSTLTIISTPGIAYAGNLSFLQLIIGYMVGRIFISLVLIPAYFKGEMYTAYELMQRRFGPRTKHATASMFLVTRALAEGVRVFAVAIVVSIVLGSGDVWSILIISALTLLYTFEGGLTAVIWTDVVQLFIYLGCTLATFFVILGLIPNGWQGVMAVAGPKMAIWDFSLNFHLPYTFWGGVIGGAFLNTASHGVDQLIVQRLLAAKNERDSKIALLSSGVVIFFQFALFLLIGVMLFSFYHYNPGLVPPSNSDKIFPTFVVSYPAAWSPRNHGGGDPGSGDVQPEQFAQCPGFDYRGGFLPAVPEEKCGRSRAIARLSMDYGLLGISAHAIGDSFARSEIRPGSRPDDRLHNLWQHARSFSPRSDDKKGQ